MQSSPPRSEGKARAIRELSRSMNGHSTRSIPSLSPPPTDSNPTQQFDANTSDFFNNDDVMMSTQHRFEEDTNTNALPQLPRIRSTAKKVGTWQPLRSEPPQPDTSMVNKQFGDFDQSVSDEEDISVEQARGGQRSSRSTPGKANSSLGLYNSLYDMTPPSGRPHKSAESGNLRRDAQIRRASRNDFDTASPRPTSTRNSPALAGKQERKRTSLAQSHAKISEDESSFMEGRPPTFTFQARSTRWGGQRSRQTSLQLDGVADTNDANRPRPGTAQTGTGQSFMLPDLPNLTELVSGVYEDGTPVFSKSTPARSRFAMPARGRPRQQNHVPIDSVPIPDEEKAIFASLQLLQERVAQLEHERAEAEKKIEEQETEIIELRAAQRAQSKFDGGTSGDSGKNIWKVEKTRLEASVQTLQKKLERSERKLSVSDIEKNRLQKERDNMATQLAVAFQNFDELKAEKEALTAENDTLRQEVDSLRAENDELHQQLEREQQQYREETVQLRRQVDEAEDLTRREAETLRAELHRVRARHDENTQQLARKEAELRKARKEQAEYAKLKADNDSLKAQLAELKASREQELRRWLNRESELKGRVERRDETIRHFQDMTQEQTNEAMRLDNENLRRELADLAAQHDEDMSRWLRKEAQLKRKISAAAEKEDLTREILSIRQANGKENRPQGGLQRRPSQRRENTRTRIAHRIQEEVRNSKSAARTSLPTQPARSASAPIFTQKKSHVDSDVESTTDLSLGPRGTPYVMSGGAAGKPSGQTIERPAPLDLTELSYIDAEQIAQLRRALEEERASLRKKEATANTERVTREDTARSVASAKSTRQQSLPRKSSMKDLTERTGTVFEDLTGRFSTRNEDVTQTDGGADISIVSNTSRRRRSAPADNMTSAFIVPDITMHGRKDTAQPETQKIVDSRSHDNDNCTVCRRNAPNPSDKPLQVPKLIPVSSRMPDEADATLRPSQSPIEALALVVKELLDERAHLHLELAACRAMLEAHDVSLGMKKRTKINETMKDILRLIEVKDTQIYHLYDVLEGQKDHEITEQEVEELTREIRMEEQQQQQQQQEGQEKKTGKKVTVRSFHESDEDEGRSASETDEELPWEGFEDTGSLNLGFGGVGRGGA
ncbi:uncharacterized protein EI97DRAFT_97028 [Westerdykella ornata]|uniref:Cep57 centrosome microtubule-binding domain-containing protein n=1 Tax=Westerdykella ornata TaxID=318751 RepID=A0A6A6JEN6_WESOR|nr:uncharacterized protein EI97DRAFT_97028 [Westerdykella ornata]KAF2274694.1 hypothetical protein EI97DRAFT_97028 [Westerdykella ornata]